MNRRLPDDEAARKEKAPPELTRRAATRRPRCIKLYVLRLCWELDAGHALSGPVICRCPQIRAARCEQISLPTNFHSQEPV
jgi:hypothetical protein